MDQFSSHSLVFRSGRITKHGSSGNISSVVILSVVALLLLIFSHHWFAYIILVCLTLLK